jgi:hypothetical protein
VVIASYNHHVRLLSPEPFWLVRTTKAYSELGADIVMESITLNDTQSKLQSQVLTFSHLLSSGPRDQY